MPLPQNVVDQLSREPQYTVGWAGQILMFTSTLFFISLVIYFGLQFGYSAYLNSNLKKLQEQVQAFGEQVPVEDQKKIVSFYSQVSNLKTILANHIFSAQLFNWLEKNTQKNVTFSKFNLNVTTNQVGLGGTAKTMDDFNQELAIFAAQADVEKISVGNVAFANGVWNFDITLLFRTGYFSAQPDFVHPGAAGLPVAPTSTPP